MNRKLISQTLNEWRANLWLAVELLIVSVIVWYAIDFCYVKILDYSSPLGFEIDHTYKIKVDEISENSPEYVDRDSEGYIADKLELIDRIRHRPDVECASWSNFAHPYNYNVSCHQYHVDTIKTQGNVRRKADPDFFKVFRIRGINGETSDELAAMFRERGVVISSNLFDDAIDARTVIGDSIYSHSDRAIAVGAVISPMKMSEYSLRIYGCKTVIESDKIERMNDLCVRIHANMDNDFIGKFMADADRHYRVGNLYIGSVTSFDSLRDFFNSESEREVILMVTAVVFLLVNIFLGLFGTFWFRTQQRVSEIAIRKVNGATYSDIFRRFIGEGIVILSIVTPIALGMDAALVSHELNEMYEDNFFSWGRFLICAAITYLLLAVMIVLGIMVPALRAMRLQPAIALHDE